MKGKKILFVDDEENVLNSLKRELYSWAKENEIPLLTATSGGQALKILLILIGDVSGHGAKAAFVTSILKSIIYSGYVKKYKNEQFSPAEFLSWLNNRICYELRKAPYMVITFASGLLDLNNHTYVYSNAAHMPLYLLRNGQCKRRNSR